MQDAAKFCPTIAFLIVSHEESLRPDAGRPAIFSPSSRSGTGQFTLRTPGLYHRELAVLLAMGPLSRVDPLSQPGVLLSLFSCEQEMWRITSNSRPEGTQQVPEGVTLSHTEQTQQISKGEWLTFDNLKDANFHVPIWHYHSSFFVSPFKAVTTSSWCSDSDSPSLHGCLYGVWTMPFPPCNRRARK